MKTRNINSFNARSKFDTGSGEANYYRLAALEDAGISDISRLPFSIRILLESALRNENGYDVTAEHIISLAQYDAKSPSDSEIPFKPARVIFQDFTGVPGVVDLAALRSAMQRLGGDPSTINPEIPVDLVIDHSLETIESDSPLALQRNEEIEFQRNRERYEFLRWGQAAFQNLNVVPPGSGITHQVNLEYLSKGIQNRSVPEGEVFFPDSLVGADSHTTMINGLGVLGWGVGGIEAEAVMLGQPVYMLLPEVVGFRLIGELSEGVTATDLVLTVTELLRERGVVGKFVEYFGNGLSSMSVPDRATLANMAPDYGATMGFFPVDFETLQYLRQTGRMPDEVDAVESYMKTNQLFRTDDTPDPLFSSIVELDLATVEASLAGPKRPQDRISLKAMKNTFQRDLEKPVSQRGFGLQGASIRQRATFDIDGVQHKMQHGDIVLAAITSCTNTSNPSVMLSAGLLARNAAQVGLKAKPWVKTTLAPGSKVVTEYLRDAGLLPYLESIGFFVVGYGCTACIGNSGPLPPVVVDVINRSDIVAASVLSGNRNFEGRINPHIKANYLASPPLVVAYALAGTINIDLTKEPLGVGSNGQDVYLRDLWPDQKDVLRYSGVALNPDTFQRMYQGIERSNESWNALPVNGGDLFEWGQESTYIQEPPFFKNMEAQPGPIKPITAARVLASLGDSVTTDHISPAGNIAVNSPAGEYLKELGVQTSQLNSYGARRGNDQVLTRGTFANGRLKNELLDGIEGGLTLDFTTGKTTSVYEASQNYLREGIPTIVLAGIDYGMGSSRDWAAKGPFLLGVKAVIAKNFERIHRSNLIGMGILPLEYLAGEDSKALGISGFETFDITIDEALEPGSVIPIQATHDDGKITLFDAVCRIDTPVELDYYRNGGILQTVLRSRLDKKAVKGA